MNASVSLRVLHEHFYCTYEKASPIDWYQIGKSIERFDEHLGTPSTTEHLTRNTLEDFARSLAIDDEPHSHVENLRKLWGFAFVHRLSDPPNFIPRPELPSFDDAESRNLLTWQLKHHLIPSKTSLQKSKWMRTQHGCAINCFERCLGRPAELADVTDKRLREFEGWMRCSRYTEKTIKAYVRYIRRLAGKQRPACLPAKEHVIEANTIGELFEQVYLPQRLRGKSENTPKKYRYGIRRYSRYLGHQATILDFDDDQLADWRDAMIEDGLSPATANNYLAHFIALWNFAWRKGLVDEGPTVKEANEYQREPVALSAAELSALFDTAAAQTGMVGRVPAAEWWTALLGVLYDTGCRVGAVLSLEWGDIRTEDNTLTIRPESQKTRKEARRRVHPDTMEAIQKLRVGGTAKVFEWPFNELYFFTHSKRLFLEAGLPNDRRYRLHSLRRTHGTLVADRLGDFAAADSLQHSHVNTFRKNYKDPTKIAACDVLAVLPRPKTKGRAV